MSRSTYWRRFFRASGRAASVSGASETFDLGCSSDDGRVEVALCRFLPVAITREFS